MGIPPFYPRLPSVLMGIIISCICLSIYPGVYPSWMTLPLLTLSGIQLLAWNMLGWCTVPWSRLLLKMAMLIAQPIFCAFPGTLKFSMIALDRVWGMTLLHSFFKDFSYHTVPWSRSLFKMAMLSQFLRIPWNFQIFHDRLGPGMLTHITKFEEITLQLRNLLAWCNVQWSGSLFEMATVGQCLHFVISAGQGCWRSLIILLLDFMANGPNKSINPLHAKFFSGIKNIYLHFMSFHHIDMT